MGSIVFSAANRVQKALGRSCCQFSSSIFRAHSRLRSDRRRGSKFPPASSLLEKRIEEKSEWWAMDGEMHEIGDNVPLRERFVIPRKNIPNTYRKRLRSKFMQRTRLVIKENEHEAWCMRYMELYNEMRENWERLYWDEGYSKKLGQDHANHDTSEDDDDDFDPNQRMPYSFGNQTQGQGFGRQQQEGNNWRNGSQMRDRYQDFSRHQAPMSSGGNNDFNARGGRDFDFNARRGRDNDFYARGGRDMDFNPRGGRDRDRDDEFGRYDSNNSRNNTSFDARPYDFDSGSE